MRPSIVKVGPRSRYEFEDLQRIVSSHTNAVLAWIGFFLTVNIAGLAGWSVLLKTPFSPVQACFWEFYHGVLLVIVNFALLVMHYRERTTRDQAMLRMRRYVRSAEDRTGWRGKTWLVWNLLNGIAILFWGFVVYSMLTGDNTPCKGNFRMLLSFGLM
ncbi:MAG: hypothetical protein AAB152_09740 [Candidatus Coatesbacteria bacterium]